ncbi:MAG: Ig-like domain-containing protein, partial [Clostridiales Family XIII bacterium]|nr:Ig-like domain-containing protein [Clostridiales Family XIII bacterium]
RSLNVDPEYYFEVEAFSSGTPRYVENTFETRGRGAELDLTRQPAGGTTSTDRVMTYETYGKDEVYVFNGITPGTYTLKHTFGVGIWGPELLTEEQLIGTGTQPTVTALNLTQFGIGSTQWGTVEVRVYPGETSGRIEVTFKYDDDPGDETPATFVKVHSSVRNSLRMGKTLDLKWETDGTSYEFVSSNPGVARVDHDGRVTAVRPGTAVITLRALDSSALVSSMMLTITP